MLQKLLEGLKIVNWRMLGIAAFVILVLAATLFIYFGHLTYRVAVGPKGADGEKFFTAISLQMRAENQRIRFKNDASDNIADWLKKIASGDFDLAITRSDLPIPKNTRTILMLRRDPILLFAPNNTNLKGIGDLKGRSIGNLGGAPANKKILEAILAFYSITPKDVRVIDIPLDDIVGTIKMNNPDAVFAIGPMGYGASKSAMLAVTKIGNGPLQLLGLDESKAVQSRNPVLCTMEIPPGSLMAAPALPKEDAQSLCVGYYLISRASLMSRVASEIGRQILDNKKKLSEALGYPVSIEAPDSGDSSLPSPIHPGIVAYVDGSEEGIFDFLEGLYWKLWMLTAILGPLLVAGKNAFSKPKENVSKQLLAQVINLIPDIMKSKRDELALLEDRLDNISNEMIVERQAGAINSEELQLLSIAISHARMMINRRHQGDSTLASNLKASA